MFNRPSKSPRANRNTRLHYNVVKVPSRRFVGGSRPTVPPVSLDLSALRKLHCPYLYQLNLERNLVPELQPTVPPGSLDHVSALEELYRCDHSHQKYIRQRISTLHDHTDEYRLPRDLILAEYEIAKLHETIYGQSRKVVAYQTNTALLTWSADPNGQSMVPITIPDDCYVHQFMKVSSGPGIEKFIHAFMQLIDQNRSGTIMSTTLYTHCPLLTARMTHQFMQSHDWTVTIQDAVTMTRYLFEHSSNYIQGLYLVLELYTSNLFRFANMLSRKPPLFRCPSNIATNRQLSDAYAEWKSSIAVAEAEWEALKHKEKLSRLLTVPHSVCCSYAGGWEVADH